MNKILKIKRLPISSFSRKQVQFIGKFHFSTNENLPTHRRKDSQWIYSTKHEQKQFRKPGSISIYMHLNSDTHNTSLRFIQHMEKADIILTNQVTKAHRYLKAITNKQQFAYEKWNQNYLNSNDKSIEKFSEFPTSLALLRQSISKDNHTLQFDTEIQISKHIQLQKQINKQRGENINHKLYEQSLEVKSYMGIKNLQIALKQIKAKQGYPAVFHINQKIQSAKQRGVEIESLRKDGFNVMYVFEEESQKVWQSGKLIKQLENKNLAYEILPCTGQIVEAIVSSGLPADRFCIQIMPSQDQSIQSLLNRRKNMKITTCIKIKIQKLDDLIKAIVKILGKQHIIYLHSKKNYFLGEASNLLNEITDLQSPISQQLKLLKLPYCYIVLSPYISEFNTQLKNQMNIENHIRGQLQSDKINTVEMEILIKKLQQMEQKDYIYQVDAVLMIAQMLSRMKNEDKVKKCLKILFPRKKAEWVQKMIKLGSSKIVIDHIGFKTKDSSAQ